MYKHHSNNNLVEKKLAQLPAADAEGLWSSMEAILDEQLPQQKRRRRLLGWLWAHKAWLLATLFVGAAAASTLVYWPGSEQPEAKAVPGSVAAKQRVPAAPAAIPAPVVATTPQQEAVPALTTYAQPSATPSQKTAPHTINPDAAPAATTIRTAPEEPLYANLAPARNTGTRARAAASVAATPATAPDDNSALPIVDAAGSAATLSARTTPNITLQESHTPEIDPSAVKVKTEALDYLSQQIAFSEAAAKKKERLPAEKGPYVGVIMGLDMSSVEFGSVKTGNNKGLIVGYAFNRRLSVESGVLWNKKHYAAAGSYYKADGYTPQPGLTILDVNSTSQLYELPLNVTYTIVAGAHKLFATAGVSSYILKRENVDLHYDWNGQQGNQYYDYHQATKYWWSVAGLSLGYAHPLGSLGSLRVEPYVKLPLKELGVCNMRVTSLGLNVGLTKTLRR